MTCVDRGVDCVHTTREACAIALVSAHVPEPSVQQRQQAADAAGAYCLARGTTSRMGTHTLVVDC